MPNVRRRAVAARPLTSLACLLLAVCFALAAGGCSAAPEPADTGTSAADGAGAQDGAATAEADRGQGGHTTLVEGFRNPDLGNGWEPIGAMELRYARCFSVDEFEGGYALVCVADGNRYLVVPEGAPAPADIASDVQVIRQPVGDVYLAASDTMCLFDALDAVDRITVSGIARDDWYVEAARAAMDEGRMAYGGKYRSPDYELLLASNVRLAIESTMVNHVPDVREKLMELSIPVLVELSSYEPEPLGRAEWIRLYGLLCGEPELAGQVFERQAQRVESMDAEPTGKSVAFFYLNGSGAAVVRRPGDYVTKMIAQAGGSYVFDNLGVATAGASSLTLQMERFLAGAKDADVLIYNGSIDESPATLDELVGREGLLADFAAVKSGDVWATDQNMYQQMIATGDIIAELHAVLSGDADDGLTYLRRLT